MHNLIALGKHPLSRVKLPRRSGRLSPYHSNVPRFIRIGISAWREPIETSGSFSFASSRWSPRLHQKLSRSFSFTLLVLASTYVRRSSSDSLVRSGITENLSCLPAALLTSHRHGMRFNPIDSSPRRSTVTTLQVPDCPATATPAFLIFMSRASLYLTRSTTSFAAFTRLELAVSGLVFFNIQF
jgi:hypothetical protein